MIRKSMCWLVLLFRIVTPTKWKAIPNNICLFKPKKAVLHSKNMCIVKCVIFTDYTRCQVCNWAKCVLTKHCTERTFQEKLLCLSDKEGACRVVQGTFWCSLFEIHELLLKKKGKHYKFRLKCSSHPPYRTSTVIFPGIFSLCANSIFWVQNVKVFEN